MSADLLAEFDSFYQAPKDSNKQPSSTSAVNDLSFFGTPGLPSDAGASGTQAQLQIPSKPNEDVWGTMTGFQPNNTKQPIQQNEDIWGSFEAATPSPVSNPSHIAPITTYGGDTGLREKPKPKMLRRDTIEMFSSSNINNWESASVNRPTPAPMDIVPKNFVPAPIKSTGGDILFDADNLSDEEDDFGDFEEAPTEAPLQQIPSTDVQSLQGFFGATSIEPKPTKRPTQLSPISAKFEHGSLPYPQAPKSPSFQERNPFVDLGVATSQVSKLQNQTREGSPVTPWPSFQPPQPAPYQDSPAPKDDFDEDWGDFTDMPPPKQTSKPVEPATGIEADAWAWDSADGVTNKPSQEVNIPPPTNVPPPSVLLPLFVFLFDLPQSALFKPVADQTFSLKNRILSDPSTIDFLRAYLLIATVAARIIAGRKLRWKRDTLLSQAMKIGPAAAGGKGGMKLAGVDKAEITREDREAADVVRIWKEQLGRLKSAVAVANSNIPDAKAHLTIPDINESMQVKTQQGGMSAPKQCVICGLKREERVSKVDNVVEDSFGEWWTDHWGHRACRNLWLEHEPKLRNR